MVEITYFGLLLFITFTWIVVRVICGTKSHKVNWKYEARLLLVYICIAVIARMVYFPMHVPEGQAVSMYFDAGKIWPFWINLIPIVHLFDIYDGWQINIIGNIAMFIPVGMVWPFCFKQLDSIRKTTLAGFGFTLCIEISQLLLYDRCSDVDDLLLNTTGVFLGALIYFSVKRLKMHNKAV